LSAAGFVFLGIFLVAVGEMMASPRIQEYITWLAPKEKAGLYMGSNFLALGIGAALSGVIYTTLYGFFRAQGRPEYIWMVSFGRRVAPNIFGLLWLATSSWELLFCFFLPR